MIAAPEPRPTERDIVERAVNLRPVLIERQPETERLTHYPKDTHDDFLRAGFYRMLQPRRYGGYEFGLPVFYRVVTEIARGCPSTGWALSLTAAHVLQVASVFEERAQDEIFGADGDFRAASTVAPIGVARPDGDDHVVLDGTWPYSSGAPYSTHYVGQTLRAPTRPGGPPEPPVLFVAPRSVWTVLDDWHGVLGLRGSGSHRSTWSRPASRPTSPVRRACLTCPSRAAASAPRCTATPCTRGAHRASSTASWPPS
ncbi:acyl-CoA dehydrogenase family protein [Streptomyces sp. NBC_01092]|uniref:acyl-CoA dehydrogenase family protein n=1 Tax=Streptomyces sp. NBC_01092 TaxID=2903748 RepID=UPI00386C733C|nr:hypothetical protein OG254_04570 [Streptomyces sp. NBC_01092]